MNVLYAILGFGLYIVIGTLVASFFTINFTDEDDIMLKIFLWPLLLVCALFVLLCWFVLLTGEVFCLLIGWSFVFEERKNKE